MNTHFICFACVDGTCFFCSSFILSLSHIDKTHSVVGQPWMLLRNFRSWCFILCIFFFKSNLWSWHLQGSFMSLMEGSQDQYLMVPLHQAPYCRYGNCCLETQKERDTAVLEIYIYIELYAFIYLFIYFLLKKMYWLPGRAVTGAHYHLFGELGFCFGVWVCTKRASFLVFKISIKEV